MGLHRGEQGDDGGMPPYVSPEPQYPCLDTSRDHRVGHLVSMTIETTPDSMQRGMVGFCAFASHLGFDLVRELPQIGDRLAQIGELSVKRAGVSHRCNGKHHAKLLERRFHGCSFAQIPLVTEPAMEGIIPLSFLLYAVVVTLLGRRAELRLCY